MTAETILGRMFRETEVRTSAFKRRRLSKELGVLPAPIPTMPIDQAQTHIREKIFEYLETENPPHMLLIQVDPGAGKTTMLAEIAEWYAEQQQYAAHQKRVFWALPRHDLFPDVVKHARVPEWWYHWIPRRGLEKQGIDPTCRYHQQIEQWMARGYNPREYCENRRICGFDYMNKECPYWAQKEIKHPIVVGVHQHMITGHMLQQQVGLVIGDEYPIGMFAGDLCIPARYIVPREMPQDQPFTEMVSIIQSLALDQTEGVIAGRDLLDRLGGAEAVYDACQLFRELADEEQSRDIKLRTPDDVERAPYKHIGMLRTYLDREASAARDPRLAAGYITRICIKDRMLCYATRKEVKDQFAKTHMIWLDATADPKAYKAAFGREVQTVKVNIQKQGKTYQMWSSLNSRHTMFDYDRKTKTATPKPHAYKIKDQIRYIIRKHAYINPLIITYQALEPFFADLAQTAGLSANRGTDRFNGCDVVFVVGRQEPSGDSVLKLAETLAFQRMEPFISDKIDRDVAFNYQDKEGYTYSYPKTDYWFEPLLQALLWQVREAEMLQSAHRGRPIWNACDIWLFTNVAVDELPLDGLYAFAQVCDAPAGIDPNKWIDLVEFAYAWIAEHRYLMARDVVEKFGCNRAVANRYLDYLTEKYPEDFPQSYEKLVGKGRPCKIVGVKSED